MVKIKKEQIWEPYKEVQKHPSPDTHIEKWIKVILKSLRNSSASTVKANDTMEISQLSDKQTEVLSECKNRLATIQANTDIYERINQFKMRMINMTKFILS